MATAPEAPNVPSPPNTPPGRPAHEEAERLLLVAAAESRPRQAAARIEEAWRHFLAARWEIPDGTPPPRWGALLARPRGGPAGGGRSRAPRRRPPLPALRAPAFGRRKPRRRCALRLPPAAPPPALSCGRSRRLPRLAVLLVSSRLRTPVYDRCPEETRQAGRGAPCDSRLPQSRSRSTRTVPRTAPGDPVVPARARAWPRTCSRSCAGPTASSPRRPARSCSTTRPRSRRTGARTSSPSSPPSARSPRRWSARPSRPTRGSPAGST